MLGVLTARKGRVRWGGLILLLVLGIGVSLLLSPPLEADTTALASSPSPALFTQTSASAADLTLTRMIDDATLTVNALTPTLEPLDQTATAIVAGATITMESLLTLWADPTALTLSAEALNITATAIVAGASETVAAQMATATPLPLIGQIDVTPYAAGNPPDSGRYSGELKSLQSIAYRLVADRDGAIVYSVETTDENSLSAQLSINRVNEFDGGVGLSDLDQVNAMQSDVLVRQDDEITITIFNYGTSPAPIPFSLTIHQVGIIDLGDEPFDRDIEGQLSYYDPVAVYRFEAPDNAFITIRAEGMDEFDTALALYDLWLQYVRFGYLSSALDNDSGAGYDAELLNIPLRYTGTYYAVVAPGRRGYGAFRLRISRDEVVPLGETPLTVRFNPSPRAMTFTGRAGETVRLVIQLPEDAADYAVDTLSLELAQDGRNLYTAEIARGTVYTRTLWLDANGQPITDINQSVWVASGADVLSTDVTIPADGEVFVYLQATGRLTRPSQQTFALTVSLER